MRKIYYLSFLGAVSKCIKHLNVLKQQLIVSGTVVETGAFLDPAIYVKSNKAAADYLKISLRTLSRLIGKGLIHATRQGAFCFFKYSDLNDFASKFPSTLRNDQKEHLNSVRFLTYSILFNSGKFSLLRFTIGRRNANVFFPNALLTDDSSIIELGNEIMPVYFSFLDSARQSITTASNQHKSFNVSEFQCSNSGCSSETLKP